MPFLSMYRIPSKRALCFAGALICFAAAFVLTPSGVRSQSSPAPEPLIGTLDTAPLAPLRPIAPRRDAFEPRAVDDPVSALPLTAIVPSAPPHGMLPAPRAAAPIRVTAIATGEHPSAIVDDGTATRTITIGDVLAGTLVTAIRAGGLELADGRHIGIGAER